MKKVLFGILLMISVDSTSAQEIRRVKAVDVEKIIAESKVPLVINMWATWCVPCIEELPYFIEAEKKYKKDSVQLLLVSLDFPESFPDKMKEFMKKRKLMHASLWLDETNADYFCPKIDPKWSGAIPATVFVNNKTGYRKLVEEKIKKDELENEIKALIQQK